MAAAGRKKRFFRAAAVIRRKCTLKTAYCKVRNRNGRHQKRSGKDPDKILKKNRHRGAGDRPCGTDPAATPCGGRRKVKRKGHRTDALALEAEERRGKLRKAVGRSKHPAIHGCLNGETRPGAARPSAGEHIARGGEPGELKQLSSRRKTTNHRFRE